MIQVLLHFQMESQVKKPARILLFSLHFSILCNIQNPPSASHINFINILPCLNGKVGIINNILRSVGMLNNNHVM